MFVKILYKIKHLVKEKITFLTIFFNGCYDVDIQIFTHTERTQQRFVCMENEEKFLKMTIQALQTV